MLRFDLSGDNIKYVGSSEDVLAEGILAQPADLQQEEALKAKGEQLGIPTETLVRNIGYTGLDLARNTDN